MKQPGVQVHPLKQMNATPRSTGVLHRRHRRAEFLVSDVGDGWSVATTTLMHSAAAPCLRSWARRRTEGPHL
jgi:hypothetical protein